MVFNDLKIYFAGSIRGGREYMATYKQIILCLSDYGHVLTEHIGYDNLGEHEHAKTDTEIYNQDINWLKQSDYIVAEVSKVSMGVGYELGYAAALGKKVICFYHAHCDSNLSAMIAGNSNFSIVYYHNISDIEQALKKFIVK